MPGSAEFKTWARNCNDKSESEIKHALERCRDFTGFFTVPAFRELCNPDPEALGLPKPELAFEQASKATTHNKHRLRPAVYHAAMDTGWFDLRNGYADKRVFVTHYERRVKQVMDGEILEIPELELLEKKKSPKLNADEVHSRCAALKESLKG